MGRYADSGNEPSLREVLDDPIVRLLMARDNVARGDLERMIEAYRGRRAVFSQIDRPASGQAGRGLHWARSLVSPAKRISR